MTIDDAKLMAFADGELSAEERAAVERALSDDAGLREKLAAHRTLRARLSGAYDTVLDEPVPAQLMAAAQGAPAREAEVVDLGARRRAAWTAREWGAMAASLAGGLIIGFGVMNAQAPLIAVTADGMSARGALAQALDTQLASDDAGAVRIGLSFRAVDGGYCRTFELTERGTSGVACRDTNGWDVAMTAAAGAQGEIRMAGASEAVLNVVATMIDGDPLDAEDEAQARDAGWTAAP
jgi:hypothetical protein